MLEDTQKDIQATSGVDGRYTGRNSGSIQTTGGTEQMLDRVTLIDTPKVMNYEKYCRNLTELILEYMIQFTPKRTYFVRDMEQLTAEAKWIPVEVDFPSIKKLTDSNQIVREYTIQISSELPRTRQHNQQWANMIMEKQMQYREQGLTVDLLTEEEWLMYQDVPYKEQMLERMGVQRQNTSLEQTAQVVHEYTNLLKQGYPPNEAMILAAQGLDAKRQGAATPFEEQQAQSQAQQAPLAGQGPASPMGGGMPIPMG